MMRKVLVSMGAVLAFAMMLGLIPVMGVTDGPQDAAAQVQGAVEDRTVYVVSRYRSGAPPVGFRTITIVTVTNTDDRTCGYNLRWRDIDGTTVPCALPGTISSGETKVFCSRRLGGQPTPLLGTCDFTCGVDAGQELLSFEEGVVFIDRTEGSSSGCANNVVIDAVIYHTIGAMDDTLQAAYDPNIIKANDGNTRNRGD